MKPVQWRERQRVFEMMKKVFVMNYILKVNS